MFRYVNLICAFCCFGFEIAEGNDQDFVCSPLANLEGDPSTIVNGSVNVITGDYIDTDVDLILPGPEPLVLQRSYTSSDVKGGHFCAVWHSNFESFLDLAGKWAHLEEGFGVITRFTDTTKIGNVRRYSIATRNLLSWVTNSGSGEISGKTNPRNNNLYLDAYQTYVQKGNGDRHYYNNWKKSFYFLDRIERPNKNYVKLHRDKARGLYRVCAQNSNGDLFSHIDVNRKSTKELDVNPQFTFSASDGREVTYHFQKRRKLLGQDLKGYFLSKVDRPNSPIVSYEYKEGHTQISKKILPNHRYLENEYYPGFNTDVGGGDYFAKLGDARKGRVYVQKAPVGTDAKPICTHVFLYHLSKNVDKQKAGRTDVIDALGYKTTYQFSKRRRLTAIEKYTGIEDPQLYTVERLTWGDQSNRDAVNLESRSFEDSNGQQIFRREYSYDKNGNVIEDRLIGNLTGCDDSYVKRSSYSADDLNLLLEEDDGRKLIRFEYYPETNLVKQKQIISDGEVLLSTYYKYDEHATLIEEFTEDGPTPTEQRIRCITPTRGPPIGLPEIVKELYVDQSTGQEVLLSKQVNHFSKEGWITRQDHYDANEVFQFSLFWEYNNYGQVTKEVDALGNEITRKYDQNGNLVYEKGPRSDCHKEMAYDYSNRIIREEIVISDGTRLSQHHKYDYLSNRVASVDIHGNETRYAYDDFGRVVAVFLPETSAGSSVRRAEYDAMSHPIAITDGNGGVTRKDFTIRGKPYRLEHPDGSVEQIEYSVDGLVAKSIATNGMVTLYTYDSLGRVTLKEEYSPEGELLSCAETGYNGFHKLYEIDPEGYATYFEYDGAGRLVRQTRGQTERSFFYDSCGRVCKSVEKVNETDAVVTIEEYDVLNRMIAERTEDLFGKIYRQNRYCYDESGNVSEEWIKTENGWMITRLEYDPLGNVIRKIDADGNHTTIDIQYQHRNELGQKVKRITTTDPLGNQSITVFDALGREERSLRKNTFGQLTQEREFHYDLVGNRICSIDRVVAEDREVINEWEYDVCNREVRQILAAGTTEQKIVRTLYNDFGQKEVVIKPDGVQLHYTYDGKGRVQSLASSDGSIHYRYQYDRNDHPIQVDDLIQNQTSEKIYEDDLLIEELLGNNLKVQYQYDLKQRPSGIVLPDDSQIQYSYEGVNLTSVSRVRNSEELYSHRYHLYDQSGKVLESSLIRDVGTLSYDYDNLSRVIKIEHSLWKESEISFDKTGNLVSLCQNDIPHDFKYDDLYQLCEESGSVSHTYSHDSLYNRTQKDEQEYKVNSLNQLVHEQYEYDLNGNLVAYGEKQFFYDALDRLITARTPEGEYHYTYDDTHRRLSKTGPEGETRYLYLGQNEVGEVNSQGKIETLRILGHGVGAEIGAAISIEIQDKLYAPIHDHNGNISCLIDVENNQIAAEYHYSAFGEETIDGILIPWRFSSKRVDPETELVYFGRRYYAPEIGRWITQDPAGFSAGPNLYAYVNNSPLSHFDLYGLYAQTAFGMEAKYCELQSNFIGSAMKFIGEQVIPPGEMKDGFSKRGRELRGESLEGYKPSAERIIGKNTDLGLPEMSSNVRISYMPGIMNTESETKFAAGEISNCFGGTNVHFTVWESQGFFPDLAECGRLQQSIINQAVIQLSVHFNSMIREMGGVDGGGEIWHIAHSRGGLVTYLALQQLPQEQRNMIRVFTFGTAKIIPGDMGKSVKNFISNNDGVPLAADTISYIGALLWGADNVEFLRSETPGFFEHSIHCDTYQGQLRRTGEVFKKIYK